MLTDFLLERIAEDERNASEIHDFACSFLPRPHEQGPFPCDCGYPARALAECEAKRKVVELHALIRRREWMNGLGERLDYEVDSFDCEECGWVGTRSPHDGWTGTTGCATLRALALPHADHPDYREEWRP